jgi:uncharacterized protein YeaO (DUF488 family)
MAIAIKNVYDKPDRSDGCRVLVMRFWPRGISKDKVDAWEKDLGTSPELIKAWKGKKISWPEFAHRYRQAMRGQLCKIADLAEMARMRTVTLLCGCKDETRCHRSLLQELIAKAAGQPRPKCKPKTSPKK